MRIISLAATHRLHVVFELARRTTTPTGKLLFQVTGGFFEFERSMIRQRLNAGLSVRPRSSATATSRSKEVLCAGTWPTRRGADADRPGSAGARQGRRHRQGSALDRIRNGHSPQTETGNGRSDGGSHRLDTTRSSRVRGDKGRDFPPAILRPQRPPAHARKKQESWPAAIAHSALARSYRAGHSLRDWLNIDYRHLAEAAIATWNEAPSPRGNHQACHDAKYWCMIRSTAGAL